MAKARKLFTIGYEQTPSKAVLDELEQAGVKLLVDVRAVALPAGLGFSKNQLAAGSISAAYRTCICAHWARRRMARDRARRQVDVLHKIYAKHLRTRRHGKNSMSSRRW